jgi:hypothetical protein
MIPEGRLFLSPEAKQAVICGHSQQAFPELGAQLVCGGEIDKAFAMYSTLAFCNLEADGSKQLTSLVFRHLEFGNAPGELIDWKFHRLPQGR